MIIKQILVQRYLVEKHFVVDAKKQQHVELPLQLPVLVNIAIQIKRYKTSLPQCAEPFARYVHQVRQLTRRLDAVSDVAVQLVVGGVLGLQKLQKAQRLVFDFGGGNVLEMKQTSYQCTITALGGLKSGCHGNMKCIQCIYIYYGCILAKKSYIRSCKILGQNLI